MKKNNIFKILISIISIVLMYISIKYTFNIIKPNSLNNKLLLFIIYLILYYFLNIISTIFHELGHLLFGILAKLSFNSFNFFKISIINDNNKLKVTKNNLLKGQTGTCHMCFIDNINYSKIKIVFYYLGGIIFNIILIILSIYFISYNIIYLKIILNILLTINIIAFITNLSLISSNYNQSSDLLNILYVFKDKDYICKRIELDKINNYLKDHDDLKDFKINIPKKINNNLDLSIMLFYVELLISKEKYSHCIYIINKILKNNNIDYNKNLLKIELIKCYLETKNISKINSIVDKELIKTINLLSKVSLLMLTYKCLILFLENSLDADKVLNEINRKMVITKDIDEINEVKHILSIFSDCKEI